MLFRSPPGEDNRPESTRELPPAAAPPRRVTSSASFEAWPGSPSDPDDDAFAGGRDAELERHVRAKLRSFIRASVELERSVVVAAAGHSAIDAAVSAIEASASFSGWATGWPGVADAGEGTSGSFDSDPDWRVEGASERDDPSD